MVASAPTRRCGKVASAGMPSFAARSASLTARSTDRRNTPGMAAISSRLFSPSIRKIGQIRSSTRQPVLLHQPARPVGLAHAPQPARAGDLVDGARGLAGAG